MYKKLKLAYTNILKKYNFIQQEHSDFSLFYSFLFF